MGTPTIPDFTASQLSFIRRARDVDIQLEHALQQIEELSGERTERQQALKDALESMREAHKHPDDSINLAGLIDDYVTRLEEFAAIDRSTSSAKKTAGKLETRVISLLRASRQEDPELFASKGVVIADLLGDDSVCKPLTENGYDTVDGYLAARTGMIVQLVSAGTIPDDLIEQADAAVYRYLDSKDLLDGWPLDRTPGGQQMRLTTASDEPDDEGELTGERVCAKLEQHFELLQPDWTAYNVVELISTHATQGAAGEDVIETVSEWVEARGEIEGNGHYTAMHLLIDLATEAVDFKAKGRNKLQIDGDPVPDALLSVFAEIERRHKEEPIELYDEVAEILGGLKASVRARLTFAKALRERADQIGGEG